MQPPSKKMDSLIGCGENWKPISDFILRSNPFLIQWK
jgi:hypothetical protein